MKIGKQLKKLTEFLLGGANMATATQASVRVPNYTDAMVTRMVTEYTASPSRDTVNALAREMNKNQRSIIAKLVREGVYKAQERTTKSGAPIVRKAELVSEIAALTGTSVDSLVKASKADLQRLVAALQSIVPSAS
tara:strand:+ start:240 stop:647 length:408 start_codon:yes stop_codon:yes gene_type:complete